MTPASFSRPVALAGSTLGAAYEARRALKNMARVLGVKGGGAWLEDRDNARYVPLAGYRVPPSGRTQWRQAEFFVDHPLVAALTRRRRPVLATGDSHHVFAHPLLPELADRPVVAVPMLAREQLVGFFIVLWAAPPRRLSTRDIRALEGISRVVTVTVDHARLYNEAERRRREAERLAERLAETLKLQSEFLANTTHELRTPLCGIMSLLTAVVDGLYQDDAERAQFIIQARACAADLLDLITNLLDMAKLDAGRLVVDREPVDVGLVFEEVRALVAPVALRSADVRLVFEPPPAGARFVRADALRLRQVLVNLVGNSLKFTPAGEITVRIGADAGVAAIEVIDTGIGVAPGNVGRLFEKFVQADGSTSRTYGGTGLGLAICKALVDLMEGTVVLESAGEGLGTRVAVSLPLCDAMVEPEAAGACAS
jgi:signal transduction histidine kinase